MVPTAGAYPSSPGQADFRLGPVWTKPVEGTRRAGDTWSGENMYIGLGTLILIIILILLLT
ncbi:MAG TPA: hypothetical protein VHH09_01215 [Acidimicrobiales bacterium]|nr:hypothetical protein [Acidimicrobiales bacterium]